jgi:hypothetical protein
VDVVYIFRHGRNDSIALRYSLRSLKHLPHGNVYIVGDKPYWARNVIHIRCDDPINSKTLNAWHKITKACVTQQIGDDFVLMNDDFIILQPQEDIHYYYAGPLEKKQKKNASWFNAKARTAELFDSPRDFELHVPIVFNKQKFLALHDCYEIGNVYLHRSLYANHYEVEGVQLSDCKIRDTRSLSDYLHSRNMFVSTSDRLERDRMFGRTMKTVFPLKSRYEK